MERSDGAGGAQRLPSEAQRVGVLEASALDEKSAAVAGSKGRRAL